MKVFKCLWLLSVAVVTMLSMSVLVFAEGGYEEDIVVFDAEATVENVDMSFTPEGNLTLVDDVTITDESSKQFITAKTKNGNYFYIVIDRLDDSENVYLLNMVDEADLMVLVTGETVPIEDVEQPKEEPVEKEDEEVVLEEPVKEETSQNKGALLLVMMVGLVGLGGAYYFVFVKGKKSKKAKIDFTEEEVYDVDEMYEDEEENYVDDEDTELLP